MIDFRSEQNIFPDLSLYNHAEKPPVFIANTGIDAVTTPAIHGPLAVFFSPTLLDPQRKKCQDMTGAKSNPFVAGGNFQ